MLVKEGLKCTKDSKLFECTKSYKIIIHNFIKEDLNSPIKIEKLDKNDSSYEGHSEIIEIYLPMLKDYDYEKENFEEDEKLIMYILKSKPNELIELIDKDEELEELVNVLNEAKRRLNDGKDSICAYLNYFDEV